MTDSDMKAIPLQVDRIEKSFADKKVLRGISFALQPGEIFGLVGLNGAGKTTLLKIVLDLLRADGGEARLFGVPSVHVSARKNLSYLPEKFQPSRYLKGYEYLQLSLAFYQRKFVRSEAEEMVHSLDLDPQVLSQRVGTYSKGMGQKLGLAAAFLVDTPLLILDEPMSGLDPKARIFLKQTMQSYRQRGRTIFFSTHILSDIDEICDRVAILHDGELKFTGTPQSFKESHSETVLEKAFLKLIEPVAAA